MVTINSKELENIVKAVAKAVGFDTRNYLNECNTDTRNAVPYLRGDYINTNIRDMVILQNNNLELKHFKRYSWEGSLIIDNENKITITVSSKNTIDRIRRPKERNRPHYLQSLCHELNSDLKPEYEQMHIEGLENTAAFSDEEYEADFETIVDMAFNAEDGYHHYVVMYEAANFEVSSISLLLLDKELRTVSEASLMEMLKPDFGTLTAPAVPEEAKPVKKDSHSLVKVKPGIKSKISNEPEKRTEIFTKEEEAAKHA
ncbi:MAG: DUF5986 family protein [Clostridia bacterium]|nr:DUF5986 family protein [Clostridia bacterium]